MTKREIVGYHIECGHYILPTITFNTKVINDSYVKYETVPVNFSPGSGFFLDGSLIALIIDGADISIILEAANKLSDMMNEQTEKSDYVFKRDEKKKDEQ